MNIGKFQKIMANPGRYENVGHKMHHHYITIKKVIVTIHNAMPECFFTISSPYACFWVNMFAEAPI